MLIGRVARGGSQELDLRGDKRHTKTGTKFTKNMIKKAVYRYSSKLTKFFRKIREILTFLEERVIVSSPNPGSVTARSSVSVALFSESCSLPLCL